MIAGAGNEGGLGMMAMDPAVMAAQPDIQLGQALMQGGLSTAPASPWQALGRIAQAAAGGYIQRGAISQLAQAFSGSAENMAKIFDGLKGGEAIANGLRSPDPMVRSQFLQLAPRAMLQLQEMNPEAIGAKKGAEENATVRPVTTMGPNGPTPGYARTSDLLGGNSAPPAPRLSAPPSPTAAVQQPAPQPAAVPPPSPVKNTNPFQPNETIDRIDVQELPRPTGGAGPSPPAAVPPPPPQLASVGEVESAKENAAANVKTFDSVYRGTTGSAMIAAQQKQNIAQLRDIADSPNFTPGAGSEAALSLQRLAAQFGIDPKGAAPREVFNQIAARVLADQFSGMKSMASETGEVGARIFKPMLDLEEKANITPEDSLAGVRAKLNMLDNAGDAMMRYGQAANAYKTKHGALDANFMTQITHDIASTRLPDPLKGESGSTARPSFSSPAAVQAAVAAGKLKSGSKFLDPDNNVRVVP